MAYSKVLVLKNFNIWLTWTSLFYVVIEDKKLVLFLFKINVREHDSVIGINDI